MFFIQTDRPMRGIYGNGDGQLYTLMDIAVDSNDNIYVLDTYNNGIQKFAYNGDFINMWYLGGNIFINNAWNWKYKIKN